MKKYWCSLSGSSMLGPNRSIRLINSFAILLFMFGFFIGLIYAIGFSISYFYSIKVDEYLKGYFFLGLISLLHYLIVLPFLIIIFSIFLFPFHKFIQKYHVIALIFFFCSIPIAIFGVPSLGLIRMPVELLVCDKKILNEICYVVGFTNLVIFTILLISGTGILFCFYEMYKGYRRLTKVDQYELSYESILKNTSFKEILIK